jgi:citrate lyase beta subunit
MTEEPAARSVLDGDALAEIDARLAAADAALARDYPGTRPGCQPVHTVYVPADRFSAGLAASWGSAALAALEANASDSAALAAATELPPDAVADAWPLVLAKLDAEPVEDLRIDFEDGYGARTDEEEDAAARAAVATIMLDIGQGSAPRHVGLRFKSLEAATRRRGLRTLDLVIGGLAAAGGVPEGFKITLPKVTSVDQVSAMVEICDRLETGYGLPDGRLRFEVQVETSQAVLGADGTATVARLIHSSDGRCDGLHFGTYDYTAGLGIAAAHQRLDHPSADHAKLVLQLAAAGTGVPVSDGSSNVLPVGDRAAVHAAWAMHARLVGRSLERGLYQGWDLHPAQLPTRYLATFVFFRAGLSDALRRLADYVGHRERGVLDEPATAQALASYVLRALDCGATTDAEVAGDSGLDRDRLARLVNRALEP